MCDQLRDDRGSLVLNSDDMDLYDAEFATFK